MQIKTTGDLKYAASAVCKLEAIFPEIYLVGGAVRDAIMGVDSTDLDFAVPNSPNEVIELLKSNQLRVYEQGIIYNTVGTTIDEFSIQITTYRSEQYDLVTRNPSVETLTDIYSDIDRRDFTMNAMALSKNEFIDIHGGVSDIEAKKIQSVLSAETKFTEDPLRILRAYRLVAAYGFNIEERTLKAAEKECERIRILSPERIGDELNKLVSGKYWSDSVFELIDNGILNVVLDVFGIATVIISDNAFAVFDDYSSQQLESMNIADRWIRIIEIIYASEKDTGSSTLDIQLTAANLCIRASLPKDTSKYIKSYFRHSKVLQPTQSDTSISPESTSSEAIFQKYGQLRELKNEGKTAYYDNREFGVSNKIFTQSIKILDELFQSAIKGIRDEEVRKEKLRKLNRIYVDHLSFRIASYIMSKKLYSHYSNTTQLEKRIKKEIPAGRLNKSDYMQAVYEAIVRVYKENLHDNQLESFSDFLNSIKSIMPLDERNYHMRGHMAHQLKYADTPDLKSKIYKSMVDLLDTESKHGLDYYDPYVDFLYYSTLAAVDMNEFRQRSGLLSEALPEYIAAANIEGKSWYAQKRAYLNSASCSVYALSLASTLHEKLTYVTYAIEDYESAGSAYIKNANRYRVYQGWFEFVIWFKSQDLDALKLNEVGDYIAGLTAYGYIDPDEDYFSTKMYETANIRNLLIGIHKLASTEKTFSERIDDKALDSIRYLAHERVLTGRNLLIALRYYINIKADAVVDANDVQITDISDSKKQENEIDKLIFNLEDKSTEFKASWKYDVKKSFGRPQPVVNKDIPCEISQTVTAFMNTDGGTVLIGVRDDRSVCGIEETDAKIFTKVNDIGGVVDKIKLEIDDIFSEKVGKEFQDFKNVTVRSYKGKTVILIRVRKVTADQIVTFGDDIYVRGEAGTRALTPKEVTGYMKNRVQN